MNYNLKELNQIPHNTYRFLKVNSLNLNEVLIPTSEKSPLKLPNETQNVSVKMMDFNNLLDFKREGSPLSKDDFKEVSKLINKGFLIETKENSKNDETLFINLYFSKEASSFLSSNKIVVRKNSSLNLVLNIESIDDDYTFNYSSTQIIVEEGATLNLSRIQRLSESSINIEGFNSDIKEEGKLNLTSIDLGGNKNILNFNKNLSKDAEGNLYQLYLGSKNKVIDINKYMHFNGESSKGNMITKGVLLDHSKKTLRFTLDFKRGAKKSVGNEEEYVMLLSPNARNASVPLLLAGENDVKGNHAASIGRINEDSLFYLMSRGLSEKEAKALLIKGALTPIVETLSHSTLKDMVYSEIDNKIKV